MRKIIFFTVSILLLTLAVSAQKTRPPVKSVAKAPAKTTLPANEISPAAWQNLADALQDEKWETSSALALENLQKLKNDNEKKQLAQLHYIYLYSLAGKVSEGKTAFEELEKTAREFVGKEFLMVSRQILANCLTKVNYICAQPGSRRVLRVTATNLSGDAIHFFEYTRLVESFDIGANSEKVGFVGGILTKVETASHKSGVKTLRLIFDKGYIKVVTD